VSGSASPSSLACLLYVMDLTVLHLAIPALSADLQPSSTQLLWIIDVYGFTHRRPLIIGHLVCSASATRMPAGPRR
jgi:hypothetical protein